MERLYPTYLRGQAYLSAHEGTEAAAEFQKIIFHRGPLVTSRSVLLLHLSSLALTHFRATGKEHVPRIRSFSRFGKMWIPTYLS